MASAVTAPNDSSDDRSGTEMDDMEEEHQEEEFTEESDFVDAFNIDVFRHSNAAWKLSAPQSLSYMGKSCLVASTVRSKSTL
jgi:hypothetical protein